MASAAFGTEAKNVFNDMMHHMAPRKAGMVERELQNFSRGSNKISQDDLIKRIDQCHQDKHRLTEFALTIAKFDKNSLEILQKMKDC